MAGRLAGRVALVTGAAQGIGLALATALANNGARAVLHDRQRERVEAEAAALRERGLSADALVADLADRQAPVQMLQEVARRGAEPDILVLCASVEIRETWDGVSDEALALQSEVNLHATARLLKAALPGMVARGFGRIIAIGSVQEMRPNADCLYYAATKVAQTSMILNLARTLRAPGVTLNIVQPGAIATERNRAVLERPDYADAVRERVPLGRIGEPDDCVGAVMLLCGPGGDYINGANIAVDGGLRL